MTRPKAPVAITGLGTVSPFGCGVDALRAGLTEGTPRTSVVERPEGYHRPQGSRRASLADDTDLLAHLDRRKARRLSVPSRRAVAAANMAIADAGLEQATPLGTDTSVVMATTYGPPGITEQMLSEIFGRGPGTASPFDFPESVANAPAAQIAIALGARGPNLTLTQRIAGPLQALLRAADLIGRGRARRAVVGAFDEVDPLLHALLDRFRALASPAADGSEQPRPFDRERNGFLLGEGATVLILERTEDATARGARIRAHLEGGGSAFDATASPWDWGHGDVALARGLRRVVDGIGLAPEAIDRIVSGASGTRRGDRLEGRVLHALWPQSLPPVLAPKATLGEYSGGHLAAAVLAAQGGDFAATPGFRTPDPSVDVVPWSGGARLPRGRVLATALGAGGSASWAVLDGG